MNNKPTLTTSPTATTKRVAGSAEVGFNERGELVCTNFRAYRKRPRNEPPLNILCEEEGVKIYEYTEHYNVVLRIPKDRPPFSSRKFINRFVDALSAIERYDTSYRDRVMAAVKSPSKKK